MGVTLAARETKKKSGDESKCAHMSVVYTVRGVKVEGCADVSINI
jgi:hypothetical protein